MDKPSNNVPLIDFAVEITHFQPPRDGQPPVSEQWTAENVQVAIKKATSKSGQIEASGGKCETSIEILTVSYSATPRKYIRSFILLIIVHLHGSLIQLLTDHNPHCNFAAS